MSNVNPSTDTPLHGPDEVIFTTKINGVDRPVTRAQAERYAQQVGSMAEQAQVLHDRKQELEAWDRFKAGFQNDPHGTIADLSKAAGGTYRGPDDNDDDGDDEMPNAAVMGQIEDLKRQIERLGGEITGVRVDTSVKAEIEDLKRANPDFGQAEIHAVMQKAATFGGLPLAEAAKLYRFEKIESDPNRGVDDGKTPPGDRQKLPINQGSGTPADRVDADKPKVDHTKPIADLLEDSWAITRDKLGLKD